MGSKLSNDGQGDTEIDSRIAKASNFFGRLYSRLWSSRDLKRSTKISVYRAVIMSTLLYAAETWDSMPEIDPKDQLAMFYTKCGSAEQGRNNVNRSRLADGNSSGPFTWCEYPHHRIPKGSSMDIWKRLRATVFNSGEAPNVWRIASILPIPKRGDLNNRQNYRGISLIPTATKILYKMVHDRIKLYFEKILRMNQDSIREGRSMIGQVFALT